MRSRVATTNRTTRSGTAPSLVAARGRSLVNMELHEVIEHPGENITYDTARMARVQLRGTWSPCVLCSDARVRRYTVPKSTDNQANGRAERLFIDISGLFHETSPGGKRFAMLCVDEFSRNKFIRFLKKPSDASEGLQKAL